MKRVLGLLLASAMALAATVGGHNGLKVSNVFPPRSLPPSTALQLEDAHGLVLWQTGKGVLPSAEELGKAAYVVFALPSGQTYRYPVVGMATSLSTLRVRVGKNVYALSTLLKNRHLSLGKDGSLVAAQASRSAKASAPKKP
ncbi:hypothetical protein TJA_23470 [Thermus sp. LT1-2-5]|uniref:hypothetical protein n=1 Tax=Thermus sp. LT1-2-5 TaxID=3026935 RepID=UPI0030E8AFC9